MQNQRGDQDYFNKQQRNDQGNAAQDGYRNNQESSRGQRNGNEDHRPFRKVFITKQQSAYTQEAILDFRRDCNINIRSVHSEIPSPFIVWKDCQFQNNLQSVIDKQKFEYPTPIQAQIFPILLSGHDLIGIAETGSGKTLAFLLPGLIHIADQDKAQRGEGPVMLILAPTRELAMQIHQQVELFSQKLNISSTVIYGGVDKGPQARDLKKGIDIVVATPGRLIDFLDNRDTTLRRVSFLVIDEADRMLDMGFEPQVRKIVNQIQKGRQTCYFSATWPKDVQKLAHDFCQENPMHVQIGDEELTINKSIVQRTVVLRQNEKKTTLYKILDNLTRQDKVLIFARTKIECENLSQDLTRNQYDCLALHGDKSQPQRDDVMRQLKSSHCRLVCATDVASRGLDVRDITHVINYDFPNTIEDYVHRIGRTGRAGDKGFSITFITEGVDDPVVIRKLLNLLRKAQQDVEPDLEAYANSQIRVEKGGGRGRGRGGRGQDRNYPREERGEYRGDRQHHDNGSQRRGGNDRGGYGGQQRNHRDGQESSGYDGNRSYRGGNEHGGYRGQERNQQDRGEYRGNGGQQHDYQGAYQGGRGQEAEYRGNGGQERSNQGTYDRSDQRGGQDKYNQNGGYDRNNQGGQQRSENRGNGGYDRNNQGDHQRSDNRGNGGYDRNNQGDHSRSDNRGNGGYDRNNHGDHQRQENRSNGGFERNHQSGQERSDNRNNGGQQTQENRNPGGQQGGRYDDQVASSRYQDNNKGREDNQRTQNNERAE